MKKKNNIPDFKNKKEEAEFWDIHSFADYWDELENVNLHVELDKAKEETLILRLQTGIKRQLKHIAQTKGLTVSTLARLWLLEKLHTLQRQHSAKA